MFFKSFLCPADEGGFHDDGRNAALRPCRLHALWARRHLSPSKQVLQILTWKILSKINQDSSHGVGSSWGSNLLCLLGVRHSGEVGERDVLGRFSVCLMIMRFLPTLRFCRPFIILGEPSIVSKIFADDDWRGPQVLDLP